MEQIDKVSCISGQHQNACRLRQLFAPRHTDQQQHTHQHSYDGVHGESGGEGDGGDEGGGAQDKEDIENVAAHDVADGDVGVALPGGGERGEQLRQRGAQGHDGQANEPFTHAKIPCQRGGGVYGHVTAPDDEHQADDAQHQQHPQGAGGCFLRRRLLVLLSHSEQIAQIEQESSPKPYAFPECDLIARPAKEEQQQGNGNHIGELNADGGLGHGKRGHAGGETQDDEHIEDVAAYDVAHSDAGAVLQGGGDAHGGLWGAGAHGHNGQTDDQLWDSEPVSKAGGSVHEPVCAFDQHDKAHDQ